MPRPDCSRKLWLASSSSGDNNCDDTQRGRGKSRWKIVLSVKDEAL